MSSLELIPSANPFPWTLALLATHQDIALDWSTGKVAFGSAEGVEAAEKALSELYKGKETPLPDLPVPFTAKTPFPQIPGIFNVLDDHLALRTYFAGRRPAFSDFSIFGTIRSSLPAIGLLKQGKHPHLSRWYMHLEGLPATQAVFKGLVNAKADQTRAAKAEKTQGTSIDAVLIGAVKGKVVVRFAPEPSGYLHIGHIKAAVLNRYLADKYDGKFLLRFDDTNPEKEEDEFEASFKGDLELLGIGWDKVVHTSDWFDKIEELARELVKKGSAFMDDTDQMTVMMREQRMALIPSRNRDSSIQDNLSRFEEMLKGTEEGQKWFLRAKMDHLSPNGALRDPAIYRCINKAHHVTGDKYKAYPTYDLACPIVDSLDGVTHALRANEYADRKPQYEWFLKTLGLPHIEIFDFSRIDFQYTLLSKRKLKYMVENQLVRDWEDPRFPTIRGMRARGMTFEGLKGFIASQGASSNTMLMEWDAIWSFNKKVIDPVAPRYWAVDEADIVKVEVKGAPIEVEVKTLPAHKKNPAVGEKKTVFSGALLMEQVDVASFGDNEEITVMDWGNAFVRSKTAGPDGKFSSVALELYLQGDFKKTSKKVHWLSAPSGEHDVVPVTLIDYDYLINKKKIEAEDDFTACLNPVTEFRSKALADANVKGLKQWDIIQFERKGFYIYLGKKDAEGRMEFGVIPDGKVSSVALKGPAWAEPTAAGTGTKGWGKTSGATAAKIPAGEDGTVAPQPAASGKSFLSEGPRGFKITSTDEMYEVGRIYGKEEVFAPAESVNMYKVKPIFE